MKPTRLYCVLPYLKTSHPVSVRGVAFRSSNDLEGLPAVSQRHLRTIFDMFFLRNDQRIGAMSYAVIDLGASRGADANVIQHLREAHVLLGYLYAGVDEKGRSGFPIEYADTYLFEPSSTINRTIIWQDEVTSDLRTPFNRRKDRREYLAGYEGLVNFRHNLWVIKGSRIYPRVPHFGLNIPQDLYLDLSTDAQKVGDEDPIVKLTRGERAWSERVEGRVFTAMQWYNRSCADETDEESAIVNLAIALECLLALPESEKVTDRFKETVVTLLGPIERLGLWLDQFYRTRSDIIHEGATEHIMFYAFDVDDRKKMAQRVSDIRKGVDRDRWSAYRTLTIYGRAVFRLCAKAILFGNQTAVEFNLDSMMLGTRDWFDRLTKCLQERSSDADAKLSCVAEALAHFDKLYYMSEGMLSRHDMVVYGRLLLTVFMDSGAQPRKDMRVLIEQIIRDDPDVPEQITRFAALSELLKGVQRVRGASPEALYTVRRYAEFVGDIMHRARVGEGLGSTS